MSYRVIDFRGTKYGSLKFKYEKNSHREAKNPPHSSS